MSFEVAGGSSPRARASSQNSTIRDNKLQSFCSFAQPSQLIRSLRLLLGDPALPPKKQRLGRFEQKFHGLGRKD
jgi:hypothetical protein